MELGGPVLCLLEPSTGTCDPAGPTPCDLGVDISVPVLTSGASSASSVMHYEFFKD